MRSNIYTQKDGGNCGRSRSPGSTRRPTATIRAVYFHYDYFNESRSFGARSIGWVVVRVDDPDRSAEIARNIDALFANSSAETKTATEKAFIQSFANQMGNIGALADCGGDGGVLHDAARDREHDGAIDS